MDKTFKGIVLNVKDKGEADKVITLLTCEEGVVYVTAKGVKKASSKLKYVSQPFCFCEVEVVEGKAGYILSGASPIEQFFELTKSLEKFYLASALSEIFQKADCFGAESYGDVIFLAKSFQSIILCAEENLGALSIKLMYELNKLSGYGFATFDCINCGGKIEVGKSVNTVLFSHTYDGFYCENCHLESVVVKKSTYKLIKEICNASEEQVFNQNYDKDEILDGMRFFFKVLSYKFNFKPKCLIEFGKIFINA